MKKFFSERYEAHSKQAEVSQRLNQFRFDQLMKDGGDEYDSVEELVKRITKLVPMAQPKDQDDEAKYHFLSTAVIGAKFGVRAISRLPPDPSYDRILTALTKSLPEINLHTSTAKATSSGGEKAP